MKLKTIALSFFLVGLGALALAHSKITTTVPENAAVVGDAPENITLTFANKIRLIKVEMTYQDHPPVAMDVGGYKSFATEFVIPNIPMGPGTYKIEWRGLGGDGHAMTGEFMFTVD